MKLWHETLTNRGIVLLTGGLIIGFLYGPREGSAVTDLFIHSFQAIPIFLLEMGLTAPTPCALPYRQVAAALFAVIAPCILGLVGLSLAAGLGMSLGTGVILAAMIASASYIAAPAAFESRYPALTLTGNADVAGHHLPFQRDFRHPAVSRVGVADRIVLIL